MSTTVTNYLSRINRNFPVRGRDNDSQGFRDNWKNIHEAISNLNTELERVGYYTVKTNDLSSFYGNTFEDITIKNASSQLYSTNLISDPIKLDYSDGSYQKFNIDAGIHQLSVINWPDSGKSGRLRIAVTASADDYSAINFDSNYTCLNSSSNLLELTNTKANVFELWNEEGSDIVYVIYLNNETIDNADVTSTTWLNELRLGNIESPTEFNLYYTGTNKSTIVRRGNQVGELGLVPNRITKKLIDAVDKTSTTSIELIFDKVLDIVPGAFLYVSLTNTIFTVTTEITTNSVFITPGNFNVSLLDLDDPITITNPWFDQQSTLLALSSNSANTFTGISSNFLGNVYADKNTLEITYKQFGNGSTNTFILKTLQTSTETSVVSEAIASTKFLHSLIPMGTIIMWYGQASEVPYGWTLCDGKESIATIVNGQPGPQIKVPDLRNRFVVGGESDVYEDFTGRFIGPGSTVASESTATRGGLKNSVIVNHSHNVDFTGNPLPLHYHDYIDPKHNHDNPPYDRILQPGNSRAVADYVNAGIEANIQFSATMTTTGTNISLDPTISGDIEGIVYVYEKGEDGTNKNIPPFYALYYIMKISGIYNDKLPVAGTAETPDPTEPSAWPTPGPIPPEPPPPPAPRPPVPPTNIRRIFVQPGSGQTFVFTAGQVSTQIQYSIKNTGNTSLLIYQIVADNDSGITANIIISQSLPASIIPDQEITFNLSYTSIDSIYGLYLGKIKILYQDSLGGTSIRVIDTNINIGISSYYSSGESGGGGTE